jgi:hypothetical protein
MSRKAVIVHGYGADSQSNWFPWLKEKLEEQGWEVAAPNFPNTLNPKLSEWLDYFHKNVRLDEQTVLIGHSLGVPFILRVLENLPKGKLVAAAYLVSGFAEPLGLTETENFVDQPFNWPKIREGAKKFVVINSDDDPYIPLEVGQRLAQKLGAELIVEHGGGHLNAPGGSLSYPQLLNLIRHS